VVDQTLALQTMNTPSSRPSPSARLDRKIERDAKAGKLDALADQAVDDFRKGRAREL